MRPLACKASVLPSNVAICQIKRDVIIQSTGAFLWFLALKNCSTQNRNSSSNFAISSQAVRGVLINLQLPTRMSHLLKERNWCTKVVFWTEHVEQGDSFFQVHCSSLGIAIIGWSLEIWTIELFFLVQSITGKQLNSWAFNYGWR